MQVIITCTSKAAPNPAPSAPHLADSLRAELQEEERRESSVGSAVWGAEEQILLKRNWKVADEKERSEAP